MNLTKPILRVTAIAILPAIITYILILYFSVKDGIDPVLVLRDPIQACDYPTIVGMISNIGVLMWSSATAICLFSSTSDLVSNIKSRQMLLFGGLLSGVLCLDDLFLLHDRHIGQNFIYVTYAFLATFILIKFYKIILKLDGIAFLLSVIFLGLSILSDKFQESLFLSYSTMQLYEEGFKFIGIACWLFFWWRASRLSINETFDKQLSILTE